MKKLIVIIFFISLTFSQEHNLIPYRDIIDRWGFSDQSGKIVIQANYEILLPFDNGIAYFENITDKGFINTTGKIITSCSKFSRTKSVKSHSDGIVSYSSFESPIIFFSNVGDTLFTLEAMKVGKFVDGLAPAQFDLFDWAFIDKKGNRKIKFPPHSVRELCPFEGNFAEITVTDQMKGYKEIFPGKVTIVNKKGKLPLKKTFSGINPLSNNTFHFRGIQEGGFIDTRGKILFRYQYILVDDFHNDRVRFKTINDKYGFFNKNGKKIIKSVYDEAFHFIEKSTLAKVDNNWILINRNNKKVVNKTWTDAKKFSNGIAAVKDTSWYFIDTSGKPLFTKRFVDVREFVDKMAGVKINNKWGFIDIKGNVVIDCKYKRINDFKNGLALVTDFNEREGYIDRKGNEYWYGGKIKKKD